MRFGSVLKSKCSKPTMWDGDYLISMLLNSSKVVPSPLCGMETKLILSNSLLLISPSSEPTGWDGDLYIPLIKSNQLSTCLIHSVLSPLRGMVTYICEMDKTLVLPFCSEPTGWDGDLLTIAKSTMKLFSLIPSPPRGMLTGQQQADPLKVAPVPSPLCGMETQLMRLLTAW